MTSVKLVREVKWYQNVETGRFEAKEGLDWAALERDRAQRMRRLLLQGAQKP
jgi:hypothetical protein